MSDNNSIVPGFDEEWDKTLKITLSYENSMPDVLHVFLQGRIDNYNTNYFQKKMDKLFSNGFTKIIFRCAALDYISSSGLGIFASYFPMFKEHGGTFVFLDLKLKVLEIFQLLGFNHFFNIANDMNEAIVFFNNAKQSTTVGFPKSFNCPMCQVKLKAGKPGKFRCANCKTIISVAENGIISI